MLIELELIDLMIPMITKNFSPNVAATAAKLKINLYRFPKKFRTGSQFSAALDAHSLILIYFAKLKRRPLSKMKKIKGDYEFAQRYSQNNIWIIFKFWILRLGTGKLQQIQFGKHEYKTWYQAPYPPKFQNCSKLFICHLCLEVSF